jgi:predicted NBD/HSP70 family sugar kinase
MTGKGKTQKYARTINSGIILEHLHKNDMCAAELAETMDLSNAAMTQITSSLLSDGLIKVAQTRAKKDLGRRPVYYAVNENYGVIATVDFSAYHIELAVADFGENIITRKKIDGVLKLTPENIYDSVIRLKDMLGAIVTPECPLRAVTVIVGGKINKNTLKVHDSNRFDNIDINLKELFLRYFKVPVWVVNDSMCYLIAEKDRGMLSSRVTDAVLLLIDAGVGGGIICNNKIVTGGNGYAGEMGMLLTVYDGAAETLDDAVGFDSLQRRLAASQKKDYSADEIVSGFNSRTPPVYDAVKHSAAALGKAIASIVEVLDCTDVVLSGMVTRFGAEYLDTVNGALPSRLQRVNIVYSKLNGDGLLMGALKKAVDIAIDEHIENR